MSLDDDAIDLNKLEDELSIAIETDVRYWRENEAKIRAVTQKVGSYEEFRDIVLAAHLRPLDKDDKLTGCRGQKLWNAYASSKPENVPTVHHSNKVLSPLLPRTQHELMRVWRIQQDADARLDLLLQLGHEKLRILFLAGLPGGFLGEVMTVLEATDRWTVQEVSAILLSFAKCLHFNLAISFLSSAETYCLKNVLKKLNDDVLNRLYTPSTD